MMAGNPNWWSMQSPSQQPSTFSSPPSHPSLFSTPQYVTESSAVVLALNSLGENQDFPQSWSQLLLGGVASEEDRFGRQSHFNQSENWEHKVLNASDVKQEVAQSTPLYGHGDGEFEACSGSTIPYNWSRQLMMPAVSSPKPCVPSLCTNILDFSNNNADWRNQHPNHSSDECNSTATGGVSKKAKVQASSTQPPLKVRKEKLGDRITALHQLLSPFGKTDTASVLFEAIEYIRFLQGQIEALSSPYLGISVSENKRHQHYDFQDAPKDLRSRGLCLVPVSCTQADGSDENGADYWAPAPGGGF